MKLVGFSVIAGLVLVGCDYESAANPSMPLTDIYGRYRHERQEGTKEWYIEFPIYQDRKSLQLSHGSWDPTGASGNDVGGSAHALYYRHEDRILTLYKTNQGQEEVLYQFEILKSHKNTMRLKVLKAGKVSGQKTMVEVGQELEFRIDRSKKTAPTAGGKSDRPRLQWFH